jgi:thymidylate synthase (FAD)
MAPDVRVIARTAFLGMPEDILEQWKTDFGTWDQDDPDDHHPKYLIEAAGRNCYHSWANPASRTNADYIANVMAQGHESVLEHVLYGFHVRGVSRTLTHELVRHRVGVAISQRSQRYVDESDAAFVLPPGLRDPALVEVWAEGCRQSLEDYRRIVVGLSADPAFRDPSTGRPRIKQIREVARAVLPGCVATDMVWSCNVRELRHIMRLRGSHHADREIRRFVVALYRLVAPDNPAFADIEEFTGDDGEPELR